MIGIPQPVDAVAPPSDQALARLRRSFASLCTLSDSVWDDLCRPWRRCDLRCGEELTREGETERGFLFILDGVHRVFFTTPAGKEHTVAFAYPGDYSGIPDSFFLQKPSEYRLESLSASSVLATDYERLSGLMDAHRALDQWARRLLAQALRGRAQRERNHRTLTARERYERFLADSPQLMRSVPLKHIASYLGMSPETLSRIRGAIS